MRLIRTLRSQSCESMKTESVIVPKGQHDCGTYPTVKVVAKYGMHYIRGNRQPSFSITGEILTPSKRAPGTYLKEPLACGCIHEDIAKHLPHLKPLIIWHLTAQNVEPMHYAPNTEYWMELHCGVSEWQNNNHYLRDGRTFWDILVDHTKAEVVGDVDELKMLAMQFDLHSRGDADTAIRRDLKKWLADRLPKVQHEFDKTMHAFGVQYIQVED